MLLFFFWAISDPKYLYIFIYRFDRKTNKNDKKGICGVYKGHCVGDIYIHVLNYIENEKYKKKRNWIK